MGRGAGAGSNSSSSSMPSKVFRGPLQEIGLGLFEPETRSAQMEKLVFNPERFMSIGDSLFNTAQGKELDPSGDPAVQNMLGALQGKTQQILDQNLANIASRGAVSSPRTFGGSARTQQLANQAGVRGAENFAAVTAPELFNLYGQNLGRQERALEGLRSFESTPGELAFQIASNFQKQKSSTDPEVGWQTFAGK